jgi:hypothetical protein
VLRASGTHLMGNGVDTTLGLDNLELRGWKSSGSLAFRDVRGPKLSRERIILIEVL